MDTPALIVDYARKVDLIQQSLLVAIHNATDERGLRILVEPPPPGTLREMAIAALHAVNTGHVYTPNGINYAAEQAVINEARGGPRVPLWSFTPREDAC